MPLESVRRAVLSLALIILSVLTSGAPASADPDFSTVGDILQGRRTLLPVDDLAVTFQIDNQATTTSLLLTSGGTIAQQVPYASAPYTGEPSVTAVVRMFNLPRDVVVTLFAGVATVRDQVSGVTQSFLNSVNSELQPNTFAPADVTGSGFRAIAFVSNVPDAGQQNPPVPTLNVAMAADVNDIGQGLFYGTPLPLPTSTGPFGIAAADFDGDGIDEIAVAQGAAGTVVVSVFRAQVTQNTLGNVTAVSFVQVGSVSVASGSPVSIALTAGTYTGTTSRQLVLVYAGGPTIAQAIAVTPTSNPMQLALTLAAPLSLFAAPATFIAAQSAPLDFYENAEQVVLFVQGIAAGLLVVLTLDSQLNVTLASDAIVPGGMSEPQLGLAVGNFDQSGTDTSPLALQIAVPVRANLGSCGIGLAVQIFNVTPSNGFALASSSLTPLEQTCGSQPAPWVGLAAGDAQGRSLRLGAPSKITTQHMQPELILGAPPMHVDYVTPANSSGPVVLNLSAVPLGFRSSYQTSVSNQSQSSRQATTSYTNAVKANVSVGVKLDVPFVESVTAKVGVSAGFMHQKSIGKRYGQYTSTSFDASTATGFDDQVWFTQQTHYIYVYPVIGQSVCPADNPGCTSSERVPLLVMFSGPTVNLQETVGGANLEWYQPVQQVGSVFSYPWSLAQLEAREGDINLLTSANPDGIVTDSSFTVEQAKWSGQQTTTSTSGSASNISWGTSASVTEKAGIFGGITGNEKFSYNGSKAVSTLYTLTTQVGESTGIGIAKPGSFPTPALYQYSIFPYVFGDDPVPGSVQKLDVGTQIQTSGILRASFTADPTNGTAGAWWQGAYPLPDVSLNHPSRWNVQIFTPLTPTPNCVPTSQTSRNWNCVTFNPPEVDIWTSEFHYMKGLLITPDGVDGEGPQLTRATAGDGLLLRARVYNYSLADMPPGSTVVVRFYGQPWDATGLSAAGDAFLIDEVTLDPLPGFNSASSGGITPNWTTASARLDTSPYGNQYLAFWVLVYMVNAHGQLVAEMPGHGLRAIPPALTDIGAATPFLESFSNNIGFYKSLFYVAPQVSIARVDAPEAGVALTAVTASAPRVRLGHKVVVSGLVTAQASVDGLVVLVRDGTASDRGKLVDVEQISHIRAGQGHLVKAVYRPQTCGTHVLSLQVLHTAAEGHTSVHVTVDAVREIDELIALMSTFPYRDMYLDSLIRARTAFQNQSTALGVAALEDFRATVLSVLQPMVFSAPLVNLLLGKVDRVLSCAG